MATSVTRIHAQIAKLQQQADALKQAAVKRVQREIELHGLTADDLFKNGDNSPNGRKGKSAKVAKASGAGAAKAPKFVDSAGNTWGGMGKRPQWLKDALAAGAALEDFLVGVVTSSPAATAKKQRTVSTKSTASTAAKRVANKPATKVSAKRKAHRKAAAGEASSEG